MLPPDLEGTRVPQFQRGSDRLVRVPVAVRRGPGAANERPPSPPGGRAAVSQGRLRSVRIEDGELLERARPEVAHIVNMVALEQRRDAATVGRARRNMQDELPVRQRLVVDRQGRLVLAKLLKGSHDPGSQPVVAAMRIQDACSLLTAQDLHR